MNAFLLADRARIEQALILGRSSGLLKQPRHWIDSARLMWSGVRVQQHWFAVCSLGASWVFDPHLPSQKLEALSRLHRGSRSLSKYHAAIKLDQISRQLRTGPHLARLFLAIHQRTLEAQTSVFVVPDCHLSAWVWGPQNSARPRSWRQAVQRGFQTLSHIHVCEADGDKLPELGWKTSLVAHFEDLRGSDRDVCGEDCPGYGGAPHRHFLVNVAAGFLGILEQCGAANSGTGVRAYDFFSGGSSASLRDLGRTGKLVSVYLPAQLGEPMQCATLLPDQHRLLQCLVRERTRKRRRNRRELSEPEILSGNRVPNIQGRRMLSCPLLDPNGLYVGFNGGGKRRGCGYKLLTSGGWLAKAKYESHTVVKFLADLAALSERLGLIVVGLVPGAHPPEWLNLDDLRVLACQNCRHVVLSRVHVRVYTTADYECRWNQYFGWSPPSPLSRTYTASGLQDLHAAIHQTGVKQSELAAAIGIDASRLSKMLKGKRPISEELLGNALSWLAGRWSEAAVALPIHNATTEPQPIQRVTVLADALQYAQRGWAVIPQVPKKKQPFVKWKEFQSRLPTNSKLMFWWSKWPDAGIALVVGEVSGVFVVDVDGVDAHEALVRGLGAEPVAPKVLSGSREPFRYHLFFRHPAIRTGVKQTPWHPKLEFRGNRGLVVLPPSLHKSGNTYQWAPGQSLDELSIPDLPTAIIEALRPAPSEPIVPAARQPDLLVTVDASRSTLEFLTGRYADGPHWNDRLYRASCDLAARGMSMDQAESLLLQAAGPWNESEEQTARRTIRSAFSSPREPSRY